MFCLILRWGCDLAIRLQHGLVASHTLLPTEMAQLDFIHLMASLVVGCFAPRTRHKNVDETSWKLDLLSGLAVLIRQHKPEVATKRLDIMAIILVRLVAHMEL